MRAVSLWIASESNRTHGPCKGLSPPWYMATQIIFLLFEPPQPTSFSKPTAAIQEDGVRFELTEAFASSVFETGTFGRSANHPRLRPKSEPRRWLCRRQTGRSPCAISEVHHFASPTGFEPAAFAQTTHCSTN